MSLKVTTIYPAFMGECNKFGIGARCVFVRLSGCNLRCYKSTLDCPCDTPEALSFSSGKSMKVDEILSEIKKYNSKYICLTGGEPLCQDVSELLTVLSREFYSVIVETNGSVPIDKYRHFKNVSFVIDYKSRSTGEMQKMLTSNFQLMDRCDYLKFVLYDDMDYCEMCRIADNWGGRLNISVGLFWGSELSYADLMDRIIADKLRVQLNIQAHKMMMLYDEERKNLKNLIIPKNI